MTELKSLKVPQKVWRIAKINAAELGVSIQDYTTAALRDYSAKMIRKEKKGEGET